MLNMVIDTNEGLEWNGLKIILESKHFVFFSLLHVNVNAIEKEDDCKRKWCT